MAHVLAHTPYMWAHIVCAVYKKHMALLHTAELVTAAGSDGQKVLFFLTEGPWAEVLGPCTLNRPWHEHAA